MRDDGKTWQWVYRQSYDAATGELIDVGRSVWDMSGIRPGTPVWLRVVDVYPKTLLLFGLDASIQPSPSSPNSASGWQGGGPITAWPSPQEILIAGCSPLRVQLGISTPLQVRTLGGGGTYPNDPAPVGSEGVYIPWSKTTVTVAHASSIPVSLAIWLRSPSGLWAVERVIAPATSSRTRVVVDNDADRVYVQALAGAGPVTLSVDYGELTAPAPLAQGAAVAIRFFATEVPRGLA